jgi:hypothetical protein
MGALPHLLEAVSTLFPNLSSPIPQLDPSDLSPSPVVVSLTTSTPNYGDLLLTAVSSPDLSSWLQVSRDEMVFDKICLVIDLSTTPAPSVEECLQFLSSSRVVLDELDLSGGAVVICLPSPHSAAEELQLMSSLKSKAMELELEWISSLVFISTTLPTSPLLPPSSSMAMIKTPRPLFGSSLMNLPMFAMLLLGCAVTFLQIQRSGGWPVVTLSAREIMASLSKWSAKFRRLYS